MSSSRLLLSPRLRSWRLGLEKLFDAKAAPSYLPSTFSGVDRIVCRQDTAEIAWAQRAARARSCPVTVVGPGPLLGVRPPTDGLPASIWYLDVAAGTDIPTDPHRTALKQAISAGNAEPNGTDVLDAWRHGGWSTLNHVSTNQPRCLEIGDANGRKRHVIAVDREFLANVPDQITRIMDENPAVQLVLAIVDDGVSATALESWADMDGVAILSQNVGDNALIAVADQLHVYAHPIGFAALLAGKPVSCLGRPFYSQWGLTTDLVPPPGHPDPVSLGDFASAALVQTTRYRDPYDGREIDFRNALNIHGFLRDRYLENRRRSYCIGVKWWNHSSVSALLEGSGGPAVFTDDFDAALGGAKDEDGRVIAWSASATDERASACAAADIPFLRVEDGFLRSVGLGAALARGASAAFDATGIYFDATRPSDLETMLETIDLGENDVDRARRLREAIVEARLTKYNVGKRATETVFAEGKVGILVPGQVADDAGILKTLSRTVDCSGKTNVNESLLKVARDRNPDAFIVYKPHPDVEADLRKGRVAEETARKYADTIVKDVDILDLIEACDRIETVSSLAGFEALMRGKDVTVHGMPFYAGWGLTEDLADCPRRTRKRTIDELVYFALIGYGRYIDPETLLPCRPEHLIGNLQRLRGDKMHGVKYTAIKFVSWFGRKIGL